MRYTQLLVLLTAAAAACRDAANPTLPLSSSTAAPVSAAGPQAAFTVSCTGLSCQFTDRSVDSGSVINRWHWSFGDGDTSVVQHPAHDYAAPGTYTVILFVFDSAGAEDSTFQPISVSGDTTAVPPQAGFSVSCDGLTCNFFDESSDSDGVIVRWDWEFGDGGTDTVPNPTHTYAAPGSYSVWHAVVDDDGLVDSLRQTVTVSADTGGGNQPPMAFFSFDCSGLTCQFTDQSVDSGGAVVRWEWLFGDDGRDTVPNPVHTYAAPGTYQVLLVIFDNGGATDTASQFVTVSDTLGTLRLEAKGFRVHGVNHARLRWTGGGAPPDSVRVFRDSVEIAVVADTTYVDNIGTTGRARYVYVVCQFSGGCSNSATVRFSRRGPTSTP